MTLRLVPYLLILANGISLVGNTIALVALPWFILVTTGSAARAGTIAFFVGLPMGIGAFLGGPVIDRVGARAASVGGDLLSGVAVAAIPALHGWGVLEFWHVAALAFIGSLFDAPSTAARQTMLPRLAEKHGVPVERLNSMFVATEHTGYLIGAPLGGLLIAAVGSSRALWVDAASFVLSATLVAAFARPGAARVQQGSYARDIRQGLRYTWTDRTLRTFLVVPALGNLVFSSLTIVLPYYARTVFDNAGALAALVAAYGGGGILGSAAFSKIGSRYRWAPTYKLAWVAATVFLVALISVPPLGGAVPILLLTGAAAGLVGPLEQVLRQRRSPEDFRGRVLSTTAGTMLLVNPIGVFAAGWLLEVWGLRATFVVIAAANLGLTLFVLKSATVGSIDDLGEAGPTATRA